jgi:predicted TIM-barrel fold metal-dependent hydrolase
MFIRETIRVLDALEIDDAEPDKIYFANAKRLLKLG